MPWAVMLGPFGPFGAENTGERASKWRCAMLAGEGDQSGFGLRISSFLRHWVFFHFRHSSLIIRGYRQRGAVQPGGGLAGQLG